MEKEEISAILNEFSDRLLKLFNRWRKYVKETEDKKPPKKVDWLKDFRLYVKRQMYNLEKRGNLKYLTMLPDSRSQELIESYEKNYGHLYGTVLIYAKLDRFTKALLELFKGWVFYFRAAEDWKDADHIGAFCYFVKVYLQRLKKKGRLKGRLELPIKLTKAERLKRERASKTYMAKYKKVHEGLAKFFEDWREFTETNGDKEVLDTTGWLEKFDIYVRRQILSREKDGRLKEPIIPDLMKRAWKKDIEERYREDRHYVKPDKFTKRLLELFEQVRELQKDLHGEYSIMVIDVDWLDTFCSRVYSAVKGYA